MMGREMDLNAWRLLVTTVKTGSVNAACDQLNMEPSTASRVIKALERDLGFELFSRNTRPVTLTTMGKIAYDQALRLIEDHTRMMAKLRTDINEMSGMIRVATYGGIGALEVAPLMVKFQQIYPDIEFDLVELMAPPPAGFIDSEGKNVDVILSYQVSEELSGVQGWYVGDMPFVACASPVYLRRHGMPRDPDDCLRHIGLTYSSAFRSPADFLVKDGQRLPLKWKNTIAFHSVLALKNALFLGAGVAVDMSLYHTFKELVEGKLEPVLGGWHVPTKECFTYVQEDSLQCRRIATFVEWLVERQRETFSKLKQEIAAAGFL
ncbi:MAG TPA: LysR family transcriptional regulator [Candidatus Aphodousia faecigallinarum]|uniref:LysR family transcriptional regulator n=1 Tax=Candidatus Aphodousia faecigallinarum TaxID=2840677 RepID=A0A9D1LG91_9BURK|nr:LysR family transcriptional regulator [Candidatus Aphodousia faecigallinarum]